MNDIKSQYAQNTPIYLIGNKLDLFNENENNRKVPFQDAQNLVNRINRKWDTFAIELSAKDENNLELINNTFYDIAEYATLIKLKLNECVLSCFGLFSKLLNIKRL